MPVATKRSRITRNKLGTTNDDDDDVFAVRKPAAGGKKTPNTTKSDTPTVSKAKPSNNKRQVQSSSSGGPLVGREQEFKDIEEPLVSSLKSGLGCCICTSYIYLSIFTHRLCVFRCVGSAGNGKDGHRPGCLDVNIAGNADSAV